MKIVWPLVAGLLLGAAGMAAWQAGTTSEDATVQVAESAPTPNPPSAQPRARPATTTLASIAATVDDFERNKALYGFISALDQPAVERLIAETRDLPSSPHRNDIARVLYIRLASIAPEAAADHVLGSFYQPSWLAAVFRAWAHADFDAALERAALLDSPENRLVAEALLQMDMPAWQRQSVAEQLDAAHLVARLATREELAAGTPEQAWMNALASPPSHERRTRLDMAIRAWTAQDPEAALRAAQAIEGQRGQQLTWSVLVDWAKSDPATAMRWLAQQERNEGTTMAATVIVGTIAQRDIDAAVTALNDLPDWARQHYQVQSALLRRWMETDLAAAADWFGTLTLAEQKQLDFVVARAFGERDPQGAFEWAMAADPKIREDVLRHVFNAIPDAATAERLFRSIDNVELQADLAIWFYDYDAYADPVNALRWAATFAPEVAEVLRGAVMRGWVGVDAEAAVRHVRAIREPALRDAAARSLIWPLLENYHADLAERLFRQMQPSQDRSFAAMNLYRYFNSHGTRDPDKAAYYWAIRSEFRGDE